MLIVADLGKLEWLVENLVDFVNESEKTLNEFIRKSPGLIQNLSYKQMVARYETEDKIPNFRPFPIPLMVIGRNFVKSVRIFEWSKIRIPKVFNFFHF